MPAPWMTVTEAKVSYIPVEVKSKKKDGGKQRKFVRTGIRINMADGSWWFHHFKFGSWTKHWPKVQATDRLNRPATELGTSKPIYLPEQKEGYKSLAHFIKDWGKGREALAKQMVTTLETAADDALTAEAEERQD